MSYYADNDWVGMDWHEGTLEITFEQYQWAVQGMMQGYMVHIENGYLELILPPQPEPEVPPEEPTP
jgi:hypothetical protein